MTPLWLWLVLPLGGALAALVAAWGWRARGAAPVSSLLPTPQNDPSRAESLAMLAEVVDTMPDGVVSVTRDGTIAFINPVAAGLGEEEAGQWVGRPLLYLLRSSQLHEAIEKVFATGQSHTLTLEEYNPDLMVLRARISPVHTPGREPMAVIMLENESQLRHLQQVRLDFVHNASHELRTPIAHILGAVEIISAQRDSLPEKVHPFLNILREESHRLKRITEDLLALASAERGPGVAARPVDLRDVVRRVMDRDWSTKPFEVSTHLPPEPVLVRLSWESAQQVVGNLVDNACNYTHEGTVAVSLTMEGGEAVLTVRDTGVGIPASDQARIFERFYRVDEHRSRQSGGTGLGLAIVKHIVEKQGGRVSVKSALGEGSTFTVHLPPAAPQDGNGTGGHPTAALTPGETDPAP